MPYYSTIKRINHSKSTKTLANFLLVQFFSKCAVFEHSSIIASFIGVVLASFHLGFVILGLWCIFSSFRLDLSQLILVSINFNFNKFHKIIHVYVVQKAPVLMKNQNNNRSC